MDTTPLLTNDDVQDRLIDAVGETGTAKIVRGDLMIQAFENAQWMYHGRVEDPEGAQGVIQDFFS